jgi:hypothetical protein
MTIVAATFFVQVYGCTFTFTLGPGATITFTHGQTGKVQQIPLVSFQAMTQEEFDVFLQSFVAQY